MFTNSVGVPGGSLTGNFDYNCVMNEVLYAYKEIDDVTVRTLVVLQAELDAALSSINPSQPKIKIKFMTQ